MNILVSQVKNHNQLRCLLGQRNKEWVQKKAVINTNWDHVISYSGEGNGNLLHYCLENLVGRGAQWASIHGVTQNQTRLKRLSMRACIGDGIGNPLQCSCLDNPRDGGAWWAAVYGVAQSRTRLKRPSSSSSSSRSVVET